MQTVELFSGTKSFSQVAEELGHETYTVDINPLCTPDLLCDLLEDPLPPLLVERLARADVVWLSPPCTTFSMASGGTHWTKNREPKTIEARKGYEMLCLCRGLADIMEEKGAIYFIENPRARARWFLPEETRRTVWYCQYGDRRAKPTDIWTNLKGWTGRRCSNGNSECHHERAPRGSRTGTQGVCRENRGVVPPGLLTELFTYIGRVV